MAEVVGIGALNWDRLYLVDRFAGAGEEVVIRGRREEAGGSAANTIAALGRLGVECGFIGRIGNDPEGKGIIDAFEEEGVDTRSIIKTSGRTGTVLAFIDESGERAMYVDPGVNDSLSPGDIDSSVIGSAGFLHVSSFAGETSMETLKGLPKIMGDAKLSFAPGFLCWKGLDFLTPFVENSSLLFLNEKESTALTGLPPEKAAEFLIDTGAETVAVTLGGRGALVADREGLYGVGGVSASVVDTTGAGDAFAAGFIFGALKGLDISLCASVGNFVASRCIQQIGARSGLPSGKDVEAFLKKDI